MRMQAILMVLAAVVLLAGCGGKQAAGFEPVDVSVYQAPPVVIDSGAIERQVRQANDLLAAGEQEEALLIYESLLARYGSQDGDFETGLCTNAALASLQLGERDKFLHYATRLRILSSGLTILPSNAQFVLAMAEAMTGGDEDRDDLRVSGRMQEAVGSALTWN